MTSTPQRAAYGIDAPTAVRTFLILGLVMIPLGIALQIPARSGAPAWLAWAGAACALNGALFLMTCAVMLWGSLIGKLRVRDRLLALVPWRGDERVLDVGCGHGLMLIGAAGHLATGRAVGIDLWSAVDQSSNSAAATIANAHAEGVGERIDLHTGDMRALPFDDATFDVVLSSWAIHNVEPATERERALAEIVRVLKPGGRVVIADIRYTDSYAAYFRSAGLADVRRFDRHHLFVIPTWTVAASKPVT